MATPQPVVATVIKACAVDLSRAGFCQTCTRWVRQALDQPKKPDCSYQSHGADNPSGLLQGPHTSPLVCPPRRYLGGAGWWWLRGDAPWGGGRNERRLRWTTMSTFLGPSYQEMGPQALLFQSQHWPGGHFHPVPTLLSCCPPDLGLSLILGPGLAWDHLQLFLCSYW